MARELSVEDAVAPLPGWATMLKRGACKRCPRCGGGRLFRRWVRMLACCPTCGYRFDREPGFFTGVYFVNFGITEVGLGLVALAYLVAKSVEPGTRPLVALVAAVVVALVVPVVAYPFSRTIWSAIDLAMSPMELDEIVAAEDALAGAEEGVPNVARDGRRR